MNMLGILPSAFLLSFRPLPIIFGCQSRPYYHTIIQHLCYSSSIFQPISIFGCQSRPYCHFHHSASLLFIEHLSAHFNLWLPIQALSSFSSFSISAIHRASFSPSLSLTANPGLIVIFIIQQLCYSSGVMPIGPNILPIGPSISP